ncbi:MAG TPA: ornithine carbamoyltransferase [Candidatus Kapabacteria bacterium]|nr:ornithine carbamoyltransferase [Candidatus Kapabacteria bacterium]
MTNSAFLSFEGYTRDDIFALFAFADYLKLLRSRNKIYQPLQGKSVAMLFEKPSLRTRASFEVGIHQLGGYAMPLSNETVGIGTRESVSDIANLLSRYNDAIVARTFKHSVVEEFAQVATIPVINALTDKYHPCQILADAYTLYEKNKFNDGVRIAFIGDGNNVAHSWIELAGIVPMNFVIACPEGFDPDPNIVAAASNNPDSTITITRDPFEAASGADVLYTDVWTSMGQESEYKERLKIFSKYQINGKLLHAAKEDAVVMHCLPAHRGEEITDEAIDGSQSIVWDEAENRLHAQKALIVKLLCPAEYNDFHLTRRLKTAALQAGR